MNHSAWKGAALSLAACLALLQAGCGESACGGFEQTESRDAPLIKELRLASQLTGDPWTAIFGLLFQDANGDLGNSSNGTAEFYLNGESAAVVSLSELFQQNGVAGESTSGELAIPLRFSEGISDGASARLALQLSDHERNLSNCYALELEFDVTAVPQN
jgi:hypothetical protein